MRKEPEFDYSPLSEENVLGTWELFKTLKIAQEEVSFVDVETVEELQTWVNDSSQLVYVASDSRTRKVIGVVRGKRDLRPERKHAVFLTAAISKDYRGHALAAKLTNYALEKMKGEGVLLARIYVYSDNTASLNAVKKLGFEQSGCVVAHHMDLEKEIAIDDVIFHKYL